MIFVDTSALYALADLRDPNHHKASGLLRQSLEASKTLLLHNYVLVEAAAVVQSRIGLASSLRLLREAENFHVHWITEEDHQRATELLEGRSRAA